jgi:uncharacterized protein YuzE
MPLHHKKTGLSGGDDRRSLTATLNEMESVLSRGKTRRRILHCRQTYCISFNESILETKEISENLYIDLDRKGNLVSMTIEHAREKANISEVSYLQMEQTVA